MTKLYNYFTLLLIAIYIFYINYINRLAFFIHPRFLGLAIACAVVIGIVALGGIVHTFRANRLIFKGQKSIFSISFTILLLTVLVFLVPIRSLSSESFNLRSSKSNISFTDEEKKQAKAKFSSTIDTTTFRFFDWISAQSLNENGVFKDKKIKSTGFVTAGKTLNTFGLSRFVISCCVVDATPVSLLVEYDYSSTFKLNDWVEIEGIFEIKPIDGKNQPVIIPTKVNKINEPDSVYLDRT